MTAPISAVAFATGLGGAVLDAAAPLGRTSEAGGGATTTGCGETGAGGCAWLVGDTIEGLAPGEEICVAPARSGT